MSEWIEASELSAILGESTVPLAEEPLAEILAKEPMRLIRVSRPSLRPLDLETYRVRLARSESEPMRTHALAEFVAVLEGLSEPACALVVQGRRSSYVLLLDRDRSVLIASAAIDPPPGADIGR